MKNLSFLGLKALFLAKGSAYPLLNIASKFVTKPSQVLENKIAFWPNKLILQSTNGFLMVADVETANIVYVSDAATKCLGISAEDLINRFKKKFKSLAYPISNRI